MQKKVVKKNPRPPRGASDAQVIEGDSANLGWHRARPLWGPHVARTIALLYICANEQPTHCLCPKICPFKSAHLPRRPHAQRPVQPLENPTVISPAHPGGQ